MIFNFHDLTSRGIRHRYQDEFEHFRNLAAARAACRRGGRRDGLVRFHTSFVGRVTDQIIMMLPEEHRANAAPGVCMPQWRRGAQPCCATFTLPHALLPGGSRTVTMFGVFDAHPMTLKGLRAAGPPVLPAARLLTMGLHVLDGLLFLQANRIAHCDVKEDNVLVDECDCCYIADLGEAIELVRRLLSTLAVGHLLHNWCACLTHGGCRHSFFSPQTQILYGSGTQSLAIKSIVRRK
jgi:serine/threonine protein kinase